MTFLLRLAALILGLAALLLLYLAFYRGPMPEARWVVPEVGMQGARLTARGSVVAEQEFELRAKTEGYLAGFNQSVGAAVRKDESLGSINNQDDAEFELKLGQLHNTHSTKTVELGIAREQFTRLKRGFDQGIIAGNEVLAARQKVDLAEAELASIQRERALVQRLSRQQKHSELQNRELVALADGVLTEKWVSNGEWIEKGKLLGRIVTTDRLTIKAFLLPDEARRLKPGEPVAVITDNPPQQWQERVLRISPIISDEGSNSHLQEVVMSYAPDAPPLGINTRVDLQFLQDAPPAALTLPLDAVSKRGDEFQVLLPDPSELPDFDTLRERRGLLAALQSAACRVSNCATQFVQLKAVTVETADSNLNQVAIAAGLRSDSRVIMPNTHTRQFDVIVLDKP